MLLPYQIPIMQAALIIGELKFRFPTGFPPPGEWQLMFNWCDGHSNKISMCVTFWLWTLAHK